MITKFDSSYVGSVDLENPGYGGTPINDRHYPNEELAGVLHKAVAYAQKMDGLGYNTFWMAEHHSMPGVASAVSVPALALPVHDKSVVLPTELSEASDTALDFSLLERSSATHFYGREG